MKNRDDLVHTRDIFSGGDITLMVGTKDMLTPFHLLR